MRCPSCQHENSPRAKFCEECATRLVVVQVEQDAAERRQLTVMFCDLVDSTRLSGRLDPEDLRAVVRAYQEACAGAIAREDGHIAQYLGDGILVYFGYPRAHEDGPRRAVRAGLEILNAIKALDERISGTYGLRSGGQAGLRVRIGIHTGMVVIGEVGAGGRTENLALGEAPNVAARVQSLAEPGSVLISGDTQRLVSSYFELTSLGTHELKGVPRPMNVFRAIREGDHTHRFDLVMSSGLTPLVGRVEELRLLRGQWEAARAGEGRTVWLSGEPGIGKSRLLQAFRGELQAEPHLRIECRCASFRQNTAFFPISDALQRLLGWGPWDSDAEKLDTLEALLRDTALPLARGVQLFASLLSLPLPEDRYPPLALTPQIQRELLLDVLCKLTDELAARRPLLFVVEDLHWIDVSTLDFLGRIKGHPRVLLLLSSRPTQANPWRGEAGVMDISLERLPPQSSEQLVLALTSGRSLPREVMAQVLDKTDGVPLFIEEQMKWLLEGGLLKPGPEGYVLAGPLPAHGALANTLRDLLMARLDRLGTAKLVAHLCAVLGRSFSSELLHAVAAQPEAQLRASLQALVEAGLLFEAREAGQLHYVFKHALIQDAAYDSLTRVTRRQYHKRIADTIREHFPEMSKTSPELLAHHYAEAGEFEAAAEHWHAAGLRAVGANAFNEAVAHFKQGLRCVEALPASEPRARRELRLCSALGFPLVATQGYCSPEVKQTYSRARVLSDQLASMLQPNERFEILNGLWSYYVVLPDFATARQLSRELEAMVKTTQLVELEPVVAVALGHEFWTGALSASRAEFERALSLYDPSRHPFYRNRFMADPGAIALVYLAWALWLQGHIEEALKKAEQAVDLARSIQEPYSLAYVLGFVSQFHFFRRMPEVTFRFADEAVRFSSEHGFPAWLATGQMCRGWSNAHTGSTEEGLAEVRSSIQLWKMLNVEMNHPTRMGLLAETCALAGRTDEALETIDRALDATRSGERYFEAELRRLKGELLLRLQPHRRLEAEQQFRLALDVSRQQGARTLELRAALSLARLLEQDGAVPEAREHLGVVCDWFTGNPPLPELSEARALLDRLATGSAPLRLAR